jgi:2-oxoglutarate ferredoxin oxidoreductase subunit alpha
MPDGPAPFAKFRPVECATYDLTGLQFEHRIGGLEKNFNSGNISYDPDNHHKMTKTRAAKIADV